MTEPQQPTFEGMEDEVVQFELRPSLEAILMVAESPVDVASLAQAVGHPTHDVEAALRELAAEYTEQNRGFELLDYAGGWRFWSRIEFGEAVEKFVLDGQQAKLSQAALETLAVVAYRQPISRSRISAIRAVNVDGVVRTLVTRGLIEELGTDGESGAMLYGTTSHFLERMGLSSLDGLPDLAPMLPDLAEMDAELEKVAVQEVAAESAPESAPESGEAPAHD